MTRTVSYGDGGHRTVPSISFDQPLTQTHSRSEDVRSRIRLPLHQFLKPVFNRSRLRPTGESASRPKLRGKLPVEVFVTANPNPNPFIFVPAGHGPNVPAHAH